MRRVRADTQTSAEWQWEPVQNYFGWKAKKLNVKKKETCYGKSRFIEVGM